MSSEHSDGRQAGAPAGPLDNLMGQLGMPSPTAVVAELQRLNLNLETMRPDIHVIAEAAGSGELKEFAGSLARFYERIWPEPKAATKRAGVAG